VQPTTSTDRYTAPNPVHLTPDGTKQAR